MSTTVPQQNVQEERFAAEIDPYLTEGTLSALAGDALGRPANTQGFTILTGGMWNRVICVSTDQPGGSLVMKVTLKIGDADLQREYTALRYFRAHTALPMPEPYLLDVGGKHLPGSVLVMAQIPGRVLSGLYDRLSGEERKGLSEEMAAHLASLHTVQEPGFGGIELPPEKRSPTWGAFWLPRFDFEVAEARRRGLLEDRLIEEIAALRPHLPPLLDIGPLATLTHYDIWAGNVMVDYRGDRLRVSGYLDPFAYYADYAREISAMYRLADEALLAAYGARHGLDAGFAARVSLYQLKMGLQLVGIYPQEAGYVAGVQRHLRHVQAAIGV